MNLKSIVITFIFTLCLDCFLLPLLISEYQEYKRKREKKKREVAFKNKMKELEIK